MKVLINIATPFSNAMHNLSNFHEVKYDLWVYFRIYRLFWEICTIVFGEFFPNLMERNTQLRDVSRYQTICLLTLFFYQAKYVFLENNCNLDIMRKYTFHENVASFKFWALA